MHARDIRWFLRFPWDPPTRMDESLPLDCAMEGDRRPAPGTQSNGVAELCTAALTESFRNAVPLRDANGPRWLARDHREPLPHERLTQGAMRFSDGGVRHRRHHGRRSRRRDRHPSDPPPPCRAPPCVAWRDSRRASRGRHSRRTSTPPMPRRAVVVVVAVVIVIAVAAIGVVHSGCTDRRRPVRVIPAVIARAAKTDAHGDARIGGGAVVSAVAPAPAWPDRALLS